MEHTEQDQNVIIAALVVYVDALSDVAERYEAEGDLDTFAMYHGELSMALTLLETYRKQ